MTFHSSGSRISALTTLACRSRDRWSSRACRLSIPYYFARSSATRISALHTWAACARSARQSRECQARASRAPAARTQVTLCGGNQVKPLAVAWDWLYGHWSPTKRAALREKPLDAHVFEIALIRKDRIPPSNILLYKAPLQALMVFSTALYRDDPCVNAILAFTDEPWKHQVLSVWRQIMARHGAWYERGGYVDTEFGQAICGLLRIWRPTTAENLFESNPSVSAFSTSSIIITRVPTALTIVGATALGPTKSSPARLPSCSSSGAPQSTACIL